MKKNNLKKRIKELEKLVEQKDRIVNVLEKELYDKKTRQDIFIHTDNKTNPIPPFVPECKKDIKYDNSCIDGGCHEYPLYWHEHEPLRCKKCNKPQHKITYTTGNPPWDFELFGGNVMSSN